MHCGSVGNNLTYWTNVSQSCVFPVTTHVIGNEWTHSGLPTNASDFNTTEEPQVEQLRRSRGVLALIGTMLSLIIFFTVFGNSLVCLAPVVNRRLRNVTNYFVVSLALADLQLGILVLPFSAINEIRREWSFGPVLCNIYQSFDVLFCTASILNLFVISIDRYFAITTPMEYPLKMSRKRAFLAIAAVWCISVLVSFLPIHMGWNAPNFKVQNYNDPRHCELTVNPIYSFLDGILLFYLPLIVMTCVYVRILLIAKNQARKINLHSGNKPFVNEHKATKILALVMGAFIICWVPYFTLFTFEPVCNCTIPVTMYQIVLWMGYINSTVNPILYGVFNREFRKAFKILLCCQRCRNQRFPHYLDSTTGAHHLRSYSAESVMEFRVLRKNDLGKKLNHCDMSTNGLITHI
ncbi:histamine H2 receptor-like [Ptychodera flava]|uniref:histamine H2 receptor-like n=1 Tax=Ptychodera flava TaxID=63121 RepID=UPI00396A49D0